MVGRILSFVLMATACLISVAAAESATHAKISTSKGNIIVELYPNKAPKTVANFLDYATSGHYDRTLIHRVAPGALIQGGGYSRLFTERPVRDPIPYEGDNGLKNERGAIAMARGDDPASATSQWFINLKDNPRLDHAVDEFGPRYGYAVFGKVVDGMAVVEAIGAVETGPGGPFEAEVPSEMIFVERVDPIDWPPAE